MADDLAQMTFIKAYNNRHKLLDRSATKSWLFQIAYRIFLDHYRKEKRRWELTPELEDEMTRYLASKDRSQVLIVQLMFYFVLI